MSALPHWAVEYLGLPWGPDRNCWSFFREIQAAHYGREVPQIDINAMHLPQVIREVDIQLATGLWKEEPHPVDGCAVLMGRGARPFHVGCYIADIDLVLHCAEGAGVLLQSRSSLELNGWTQLRYFRCCA